MKLLLSPAKIMREVTSDYQVSMPEYIENAKLLLSGLKKLDSMQIAELMHVNDKLALQSVERFRDFAFDDLGTCAIFAYAGIQYKALDALRFDEEDILYAQDHLHIISAMYGILRPLDVIYPYRLEMQTRYAPKGYRDLYDFWHDVMEKHYRDEVIIDAMSVEYSTVLPPSLKNTPNYIRIEFYEQRGTQLKAISTQVKKARGLLARWMILHKIEHVDELKAFDLDGYHYEESLGSTHLMVFVKA